MANRDYYGIDDDGIDELKKTQDVILEAMRRPRIRLESAAFVIMVGEDND